MLTQLDPYAHHIEAASTCYTWLNSLLQIVSENTIQLENLKIYILPCTHITPTSGEYESVLLPSTILVDTEEEITNLETQMKSLSVPKKSDEINNRIAELNITLLQCKTINNRLNSLIPDTELTKGLITRVQTLQSLCHKFIAVNYDDGWLLAILSELDSIFTYLKGAKDMINRINGALKSSKKLSTDEYTSFGVIARDVQLCQTGVQE